MKKLIFILLIIFSVPSMASEICNVSMVVRPYENSFHDHECHDHRYKKIKVSCTHKKDEAKLKEKAGISQMDFKPKFYQTLTHLNYEPYVPCTQSMSLIHGVGNAQELVRACVFIKK